MRTARARRISSQVIRVAIIAAIVVGASHADAKKKKKKPKPPPPITVTLSVTPSTINEGQTSTFTVTASPAPTSTLSVNYSMSGTATATSDYTLSGTANHASITAGHTSTTVTLHAVAADGVSPEPNESATMTLGTGSGYTLGTTKTATVTIVDVAPPAAPTATDATNVSGSGFTANWNAVTNATGYRLDVATDNGFTNFVSGNHDVDLGNVLSIAISGLTNETNYFYRVRAYGAGGTSGNSNTISVSTPPLSGTFLPVRGIFANFEHRGTNGVYNPGDLLHNWDVVDGTTGLTAGQEAALQMDKMREFGVNHITMGINTADATYTGTFQPPDCNMPPAGGLQWPQPTQQELDNLKKLFDLAQQKGIGMILHLSNNHQEEEPPTNSQTWLGAVLGAIGNHPALAIALFDGDEHVHNFKPPTCGIPAEPPLWLGPDSYAGKYVKWAIGYAMTLGVPANKLSAEAIVGSFNIESKAARDAGQSFDHLWSPIAVLKSIFDADNVPNDQRVYALSFYAHRKCIDTDQFGPPCTEEDPAPWADETAQYVRSVTGPNARIVATEMGLFDPAPDYWSTEHALEHLYVVFQKYRMDGGSFWKWVAQNSAEESDTSHATQVKKLGLDFVYNAPQKEIEDAGGFHAPILNRSFENGASTADHWTISGSGTGARYLLAGETGEPEVPSRGQYDLRLTTGAGAIDTITATSDAMSILSNTLYTTTANLRFNFSGDPLPSGDPTLRPQVFVRFNYFDADGNPSAVRASDTFRYFQENSTTGFATFPMQYTTPADAASLKIDIGASRNALANPITVDADNLR